MYRMDNVLNGPVRKYFLNTSEPTTVGIAGTADSSLYKRHVTSQSCLVTLLLPVYVDMGWNYFMVFFCEDI